MSGTITLPSGDKLITQTEIIGSGALVHREEVIVSGTISGRLALPTNTEPSLNDYGLPVREISGPNIGVLGTPLRIDPTGATTQPISIASTVTVAHPGTIGVVVISQPAITFNGPQPISSVAGTVQVAFTPSAVQSVNLINVGFAGTPIRTDPTGQTTQPISIASNVNIGAVAGTVQVAFTPSSTQDVNLKNVGFAGTPLVTSFSGTPSVNIAEMPPIPLSPITFASPQPISNVAGTVSVTFPSAQFVSINNTPSVTFSGQQPIHGTVVVSSIPPITFASPQAVTFGTISLADYARYSEQLTQSSRLSTIDNSVISARDELRGTLTVKFPSSQSVSISNTPAITFSGQQPIHGTVVVSSLPPITFASAQPISTVAGTVNVAFTPASLQSVALMNVGFAGTPLVTSFAGTPSVNIATMPSISLSPITFASPQPISTIAGTVAISFTPASSQSVILTTPAAAGSVLALNDEQLIQSGYLEQIRDQTDETRDILNTVYHATSSPQGNFWSVGGEYTNSPLALSSGQAAPVRITRTHGLHSNLRREDGIEIGTSGTPLRIDPTGTTTQPVSISAAVPISSVAGTVQVAFTPSATQSVTLTSAAGGGSVLALYSEQQLQTTALQLIDDSIHAANAAFSKAVAIGGQRDDENITLATENTVSPVRITSYRAQHVSLRNEIGVEVGSSGTPLRIDPTGTTTQPISIASNVNIGAVAGTVQVLFPSSPTISISSVAGTVAAQEHGRSMTPTAIQAKSSGDNTIISTPGGSSRLRIYHIMSSLDDVNGISISFKAGASGSPLYKHRLNSQGFTFAHNIKPHYWDLPLNTALIGNLSRAGTVEFTAEYEIK